MYKTFDEIFDECVDRINRGQRLEDCLASYPEHAEELEPLLRAMLDTQMAYTFVPSSTTKMAARQRFNVAAERLERRREKRQPLLPQVLGWSRAWGAVAAVLLVALIGYFGVRPALFPTGPGLQPGPEGKFALLISDEVNDIEDFEHLYVTISSIGVHQDGEPGVWHLLDPEPDPDGDGIDGIDLRPLVGPNAVVIWSGNIAAGDYDKVFIYVSDATGVPVGAGEGETAEVKLPSNKLQISKPFTISSDSAVNFVYDITVVKAGQSGKYILKPQIAESGADQGFNDVTPEGQPEAELQLQLEGNRGPGEEVSLLVTAEGSAVEGATVTVNGEEAGNTGADGRLTIILPDTAGKVKIQAILEDKSGKLKFELEEPEGQLEWFGGTITAISEGDNASPWTMSLKGIKGSVTVYIAELQGTPSVGAKAIVEGVLKDNTIEQGKAEIENQD
jgi:hypothetical protein